MKEGEDGRSKANGSRVHCKKWSWLKRAHTITTPLTSANRRQRGSFLALPSLYVTVHSFWPVVWLPLGLVFSLGLLGVPQGTYWPLAPDWVISD